MVIEVSKEKFKSVGLELQHAKVRTREVVTALSEYNMERKQEESKQEMNPQILEKITGREY